jgi:hypothetical protein
MLLWQEPQTPPVLSWPPQDSKGSGTCERAAAAGRHGGDRSAGQRFVGLRPATHRGLTFCLPAASSTRCRMALCSAGYRSVSARLGSERCRHQRQGLCRAMRAVGEVRPLTRDFARVGP